MKRVVAYARFWLLVFLAVIGGIANAAGTCAGWQLTSSPDYSAALGAVEGGAADSNFCALDTDWARNPGGSCASTAYSATVLAISDSGAPYHYTWTRQGCAPDVEPVPAGDTGNSPVSTRLALNCLLWGSVLAAGFHGFGQGRRP